MRIGGWKSTVSIQVLQTFKARCPPGGFAARNKVGPARLFSERSSWASRIVYSARESSSLYSFILRSHEGIALTEYPTPWQWASLQKPKMEELLKEFSAFAAIRKFIILWVREKFTAFLDVTPRNLVKSYQYWILGCGLKIEEIHFTETLLTCYRTRALHHKRERPCSLETANGPYPYRDPKHALGTEECV